MTVLLVWKFVNDQGGRTRDSFQSITIDVNLMSTKGCVGAHRLGEVASERSCPTE